MDSPDELIRYLIKTEGAEASRRAFDDVTKGMKENTQASNENAHAHSENARAHSELLEQQHKLAQGVNQLRFALGQLAPDLMSTVESFHFAAAGGKAFAEALGIAAGGGLIIGGVIGALTLLADHQKEAAEEAKKHAEALEHEAKVAEEAKKVFDALVAKNLHRPGDINPDEQQELNTLGRALYDARNGPAEERKRLRDAYNAAKERSDERRYRETEARRAEALDFQAEADEADRPDAVKSATSTAKGKYDIDDTEQRIREVQAADDRYFKNYLDRMSQELDAKDLLRRQDRDREKAQLEQSEQDYEGMIARQRAVHADLQEDEKRALARRQSDSDTYKKVGIDAFTSVGSVGINALQEVVKGHHLAFKQIIGSIGDAMVASGTRWLFEGLAMALIPGMQANGLALAGIGTAEIGAGLALGAASSGGSVGGSGGGSQGRQEFQQAHSPLAATPGNGSPNPNVVNVYFQSTMTPTPRDAIAIQRAMQEGQRQGYV